MDKLIKGDIPWKLIDRILGRLCQDHIRACQDTASSYLKLLRTCQDLERSFQDPASSYLKLLRTCQDLERSFQDPASSYLKLLSTCQVQLTGSYSLQDVCKIMQDHAKDPAKTKDPASWTWWILSSLGKNLHDLRMIFQDLDKFLAVLGKITVGPYSIKRGMRLRWSGSCRTLQNIDYTG